MSTNSIPPALTDLLVKLRILSMIERGMKINMGSLTFVSCSSWIGAIQRSLNGEGRKSLVVHLNNIIEQAINAISEYQNTEFCKIIVNALSDSKIGINNLIITYQNDPSVVAQIKTCLENIDIQLNKNRKYLNGHKQMSDEELDEQTKNIEYFSTKM